MGNVLNTDSRTGSQGYEVGLIAAAGGGWTLGYDSWGHGGELLAEKCGEGMGKLLQAYNIALIQQTAAQNRGQLLSQTVLPDGRVVFIELKSDVGSLEPEQRAFRDAAKPHGIWALCRSVDEVEAALRGWGVAMRNVPAGYFAAADFNMGEAA